VTVTPGVRAIIAEVAIHAPADKRIREHHEPSHARQVILAEELQIRHGQRLSRRDGNGAHLRGQDI
jgi:hypothetical protein